MLRTYFKSFIHGAGFLLVLAVLALAGWVLDSATPVVHFIPVLSSYGHEILLDIGIAITLAVSLNLILGIAGQFSLGHAGFLAAGAYTSVLIAGLWFEPQLRFWMYGPCHLSANWAFQMIMLTGMVGGGLVAAVLGLLVGLPTLRLRGDYLAIATLGFGEILAVLITNTEFLGRSTGLSLTGMRGEWISAQIDANPDSPLLKVVQDYGENNNYYVGVFWVFAVAVLTIYIVHNIKYATSGRALLAVREDGIASESVGVSTTRYKVTAFVIGAALAGVAGGLFSHHKSLVNPSSFRFMRSIEIVAMVILGGQGSITGAVLAAIILTLVPEVLRSWVPPSIVDANTMEKWRMVFYSLFIILSMLFMPRGLFGRYEISDLFKWFVRLILRRPGVDFYGGSLGPLMVWAGLPTGLGNARGELPPGVATLITEKEAEWEAGTDGPLLQVSHVCMQFGGLRAVDDFNLELRHGELVGLIGPNGAGKTTAFNVLTGVYRPTAGEIRFAGRSIAGRRPHVISNRGIARTFQNIRVFGNLSVLDNVQIAQHAHHRQGIISAVMRTPWFFAEEKQSRRHALGYLDLFGLAHLANEQAGSLSYGDQRRLEIARALATRPKLFLLDEPAAGMNPTEKRELMEMIRTIRARFGLTILIIEHDMKVIMGICQRIVVLDYGKTIAAGTPDEIRKNPAVIEAYLGASAKQE